jgi:16S rRNA (adenine1518-N6/adenine1519-N6)-dimethyltransferase
VTAPDARALLQKHALRAKKSWGQNFLVAERVFDAIVDACALGPDDWAIEIGAGLGTLTWRLAERAGRVIAVERDRDLVAVLREELGAHPRVEIAEANALTFDYAAVAARAGRAPTVVGNLPYQIASPLLFRLLEARARLTRIVVMLQREMADRIVARPATPAYGALSVMVQLYGAPRVVTRVSAGAFVPAPRVESAVLCVAPHAGGATRVPVDDEAHFSRVVHAAFNQRRKTLRNALRQIAAGDDAALDAALAAADIDGRRRGETLSVEEFARLARALPRHA